MNTIKTDTFFRFFIFFLCVVSFWLPLIIPNWHGKLLGLVFIVWLFKVVRNSEYKFPSKNLFFIVSVLLVVVSLGGILYSDNFSTGLQYVETLTPLLALLLILFDVKLTTYEIRRILLSFIAGVIVLNLASLAFISYDLWDPVNLQSNIIIANNAIVKIHPVFLSLYISFCIFFIVDQFFPLNTVNRAKTGWTLFSLSVLVIYLIWINSRTGILAFFTGAVFYSFYKFKGKQRMISFTFLLLIVILIFCIPFSQERFLNAPLRTLLGDDSTITNDRNTYTLVARKQILDCSIELVNDTKFFYGYGTGDFREELRKCYQSKGYTYAYQENLDSHNEYFAQLHRHGIVGLILFLAFLITPFLHGVKYKSPLLIVFILQFAVTALFENVLSAQKGVTFFALVCPLLMLLAKQQSKLNDLNNP